MRAENQVAFVLRSQSYLESSLLVDVFCKDYGRLRLIAKGAKSGRAAKAAKLQPFAELLIGWQGKSELKTLTAIDSSQMLLDRPDRLISGMYLNELMFFLVKEADPHPELYRLYRQSLAALQVESELQAILRNFEFGLLEELGYAIDFSADMDANPLSEKHCYQYYPDAGFRLTSANTEGAIPGAAIIQLVEHGLNSPLALKVAKILCRSHLDLLLAGRELQSRNWYQGSAPLQ